MGPSDMLEQCVLCGRSERRVRTTSSERLGSRNGVRETGASERGADVCGATECDGGERDGDERDGDERDGGERNLVASVRSGHTCKREVTYTVCKMQVRAGGMLQRNQIVHAYRKLGCGFTHLT